MPSSLLTSKFLSITHLSITYVSTLPSIRYLFAIMSNNGVIVILGVTGAGKSFFINKLKDAGADTAPVAVVAEGHTLKSETKRCEAVQIVLDDETEDDARSITVIDTPGFDDTNRTDADVLKEITEKLATLHASGYPLKGVLYFHKITENRMTGSSKRYLNILEKLVGENAMKNVIMVTTMWYLLMPHGDVGRGDGLRREQELTDEFWRPLIDRGAWVARFEGTHESAMQIVSQLASKQPVVLDHQRQIVEDELDLKGTGAGKSLEEELEANKVTYLARLAALEQELKHATDKDLAKKTEREIDQVRSLLKRVEQALDTLKSRPGPGIKEKVAKLMSGDNGARAITATLLSTLIHVTLYIVNLVSG
ncbi:P-loop containing nucleoside triphosphate hydrolase protein [Cladorrhinum sp. PSN332]|nr:P-loop containing nucleoside triphosphate hydrolase protein [Cladorrhinum sp. PSN332]